MKQFACGDVVPGCEATFVCSTEEDLLADVAAHASKAHSMDSIPQSVIDDVRSKIVDAS